MLGKPISRGMPMGADGSPGLAGDSLEDPEDTRMAEMIVTAIWKENEAARTQRLRSPKVRWKAEIKPAPSRKERIEVRDLVQARDGVAMGRSLAPRARNMVFPVCFGRLLLVNVTIYNMDRIS